MSDRPSQRKYAYVAVTAWCAFLTDWGFGIVQLEPMAWNAHKIVAGGWLVGLWTPGMLLAVVMLVPFVLRTTEVDAHV